MTAERALTEPSENGGPDGGEEARGSRPELERVLLREDGTAWTIDRMERKDFCFHVRARRRDGSAPDGGDDAPRGLDPEVLEDAPVRRGERIEWRRPDGTVAWSMTCPVGPVEWDDPEDLAS